MLNYINAETIPVLFFNIISSFIKAFVRRGNDNFFNKDIYNLLKCLLKLNSSLAHFSFFFTLNFVNACGHYGVFSALFSQNLLGPLLTGTKPIPLDLKAPNSHSSYNKFMSQYLCILTGHRQLIAEEIDHEIEYC